jgi:adenosylcobyric acid synthase
MAEIERRTGWRSFGLVPWLSAARRLPAEDAVVLERSVDHRQGTVKIVAPMLSRMANFDDADPLRAEPNVDFAFIPPGTPLPRDAEIVVLFGTKSTRADLDFLRAQGWDVDIAAHARSGGHVLGICGGLQMLGRSIADPEGFDGAPGTSIGLGLLDIDTTMLADKRVRLVDGRSVLGDHVHGYEIHVGRTTGPDCARPVVRLADGPDGATSLNGRVSGTYVHGLFAADGFRRAWLERLRSGSASSLRFEAALDQGLDELADGVAAAIDLDALLAEARSPGWVPWPRAAPGSG